MRCRHGEDSVGRSCSRQDPLAITLGGVRGGPSVDAGGIVLIVRDDVAGRSDTLFSDDAITRIQKSARGLPRAVNNLAVQALVAAYAAGAAIVDDKAARTAVAEVNDQ